MEKRYVSLVCSKSCDGDAFEGWGYSIVRSECTDILQYGSSLVTFDFEVGFRDSVFGVCICGCGLRLYGTQC